MVRLRRKESSSFQISAAAEVLEVRSLLSGAAAAVHSAALHAQAAEQTPAVAGVAPATGKTTSTSYQVTVQIPDLNGNPPQQSAGLLVISPVSTTVGSHVTAAVSATFTLTGIPALAALFVKGKVLSSSSNGSTTTVNLAPTGTLKLTGSAGGHTFRGHARAIAPMTITLDDASGKVTSLQTSIKFPSSHGTPPPPFYVLAYTP